MNEEILKDLFGQYEISDKSDIQLMYIPHINNPKIILLAKNKSSYKEGLKIYNPSGVKGRMLKGFLNSNYMLTKNLFKIQYINRKGQNGIIGEIEKLLEKHINYSILIGTKGIFQKNTIQVADNNNIIGYVKYSNKLDVIDKIINEGNMLNLLKDIHFQYAVIPKLIYSGKQEDMYFIFQSAESEIKKKQNSLKKVHVDFLLELANMKSSSNFNMETYVAKNQLDIKFIKNNKIVNEAFKILEKFYLDNNYKMIITHGDFAPWNIGYSDNLIYVYDWEYGDTILPIGVDIVHFIFQTLTLLNKIDDPNKIFNSILKNNYVNEYFKYFNVDNSSIKYSILFYLFHMWNLNTDKRIKEKENKIINNIDDNIYNIIEKTIEYIVVNNG